MESILSWIIIPAAFALDLMMGDPRALPHPVRWMGKAIAVGEPFFRRIPLSLVTAGALFVAFQVCITGVLTWIVLIAAQQIHPLIHAGVEIILIFFCISARSLQDAASEIQRCLQQGNVQAARRKVALIVGRDVADYDADGIARATVETVAENLVDGLISPLFFAAIGGAPVAMMYKMVNTLDSMIGYKNETYIHFGKAAARFDDVVNFIPARLSVPLISIATHILSGHGKRSLQTAFNEGANHSSPNAGYPEAAFAGALAVKLNGPNYYNGQLIDKPYLGIQFGKPIALDIKKACDIMMLSSFLWIMIVSGFVLYI